MPAQLVDDGRHGAEDLGFSGSGDVALVVDEDGVQQRRDKVLPDLEDGEGRRKKGGVRTDRQRGNFQTEAI